ncbi:MAG: hypothetical protein IJ371_03895 [Clostridia bacterium]|nr:hypothetical protein [Clostridia bacterium]
MKKILNLMIAFVCVLSCAFVFSGCDMFHKDHKASEEWIMNSSHHWHECSECGEKVDKAEHDWKETILIEATQTEDGIKHYECKDCGMDKVKEYSITTVTEEIWNTALNLAAVDKYKAYAKGELADGTPAGDMTLTKDMNILLYESISSIEYYSKEGDKYYNYKQVSGEWTKTEITQENYEDKCGKSLAKDLIFSNFTYNEELKAYEGNIEGKVYKVYFESGKLVKFVEIEEGVRVQTLTIQYIDTELQLPTVG